jgi:hypothetical protein
MEGQGINDTNDLDAIESFLNQIFTGMRVSTLNPSLIDNVMDQSFREQKVQQFAASDEFIQGLETVQIQEGDEYSCGICLEEFKVGENVLKLPCKDTPHYFHFKDENKEALEGEELEETCDGILPWLKIKNSCPICRCEFPKGDEVCLEGTYTENNEQTMNQEINNPFILRPFMMGMNPFQSPVELTEEQRAGLQHGPVPDGNDVDGLIPLEPNIMQRELRPRMIEVNLSDMIQQSMNTILEEREERMMQEVLYKSFLDSRQDTNESIITEIDDTSEPQ